MKKFIQITATIIIFIIAALYFLDGLEYTEAEREWCKEHRPLLAINLCKRIWVLRHEKTSDYNNRLQHP